MSKTVVKAAGISLSDTFAFTGTVTGASDIVLIKTVTVSSSVSSVEFKDGVDGVVFDNTYTNYKVIGSDVDNTSSDAELLGQISSDTGSSYKTSGYRGTSFQAYNNGSNSGTAQDNWTNGIPLLKNMDNNTTETGYFEWSINNPSTSSLQPLLSISAGRDSDTTAYANLYLSAGFYNDTAIVVDAVKISATAGNLDGGVFKLYGYK
tara:strand:+ start:36 stop:653 length:618 start_codon:yes stop_codon:yes gene_type:complete